MRGEGDKPEKDSPWMQVRLYRADGESLLALVEGDETVADCFHRLFGQAVKNGHLEKAKELVRRLQGGQ